MTNPRSKSAQEAALLFLVSATPFFVSQPAASFILVWSLIDTELKWQCEARELAAGACRLTHPAGQNQIQSAAFQKDRARVKAFEEWAQD